MRKNELQAPKGPRLKSASRALSASGRPWQSWAFTALLALFGTGLPAQANEIGQVAVMKQGLYQCETPGNALGKTGIRHEDEDFTILHASVYSVKGGRGIYLLTGDVIRFTSGPRKGQKFRRVSENFLRKTDALGKDTDMRCVRAVMNNQPQEGKE
jgi:hypothetical protein